MIDSQYSQILVVAGSSIFVFSSDVQLEPSLDRDILVPRGVSGSDLWSFLLYIVSQTPILDTLYGTTDRIEGDGNRATIVVLGRLSCVVNDGLVILSKVSLSVMAGEKGTNLI